MIRPDAPTQRPCAPDERPAGCAAGHVYPLCGCGARPRTTAPLPPPDRVAPLVALALDLRAMRDRHDRGLHALSVEETGRYARELAAAIARGG